MWVTASQSNALLEFSASELLRDPSRALQAVVRVGSEPVGLLLADGGRIALVANSNRGLVQGTGGDVPQTVSVIRTAPALGKRPALIGAVPAGLFPRDLTFDPATGEVLLANFSSDTVEEFRVLSTISPVTGHREPRQAVVSSRRPAPRRQVDGGQHSVAAAGAAGRVQTATGGVGRPERDPQANRLIQPRTAR